MEDILTQITKDASSVKYAHVKKAAQGALGNVTNFIMLKVRHFVIVKKNHLYDDVNRGFVAYIYAVKLLTD